MGTTTRMGDSGARERVRRGRGRAVLPGIFVQAAESVYTALLSVSFLIALFIVDTRTFGRPPHSPPSSISSPSSSGQGGGYFSRWTAGARRRSSDSTRSTSAGAGSPPSPVNASWSSQQTCASAGGEAFAGSPSARSPATSYDPRVLHHFQAKLARREAARALALQRYILVALVSSPFLLFAGLWLAHRHLATAARTLAGRYAPVAQEAGVKSWRSLVDAAQHATMGARDVYAHAVSSSF